ncbi:hypothetical protein [Algoriphagus sp.]|uniref:hypothetical protein n=1 Tax=Algoriphagus sp. TaxID=1872435 RepID=UPI00391B9660
MIEIKKCLFGVFAILLFSTGSSSAQSTCDTTPDVGQTVGRCFVVTTSQGDLATCNTSNPEGEICYFGEPKVEG